MQVLIQSFHVIWFLDLPNKTNPFPALWNGDNSKLLSKGVLKKTEYVDEDFLSTIFVWLKKDGSYRMILNLKPLNEFLSYYHFKMDTIQTALKRIRPGCFTASVDLHVKDAYYSALLLKKTGVITNTHAYPMAWLFTKDLKPVYSHIRSMGHICMGHIDGSFLVAYKYTVWKRNVQVSTNAPQIKKNDF